MSSEIFPDLPGLDIKIRRRQQHKTAVLTSLNGKEHRASWWTTPRYEFTLRFNFLRQKPEIGLDEVATLSEFMQRHKGQFDSFLFDDPVDGVQRRVRFASDEIEVTRFLGGVYEGSVDLIEVK
jgi:hypothetical protein